MLSTPHVLTTKRTNVLSLNAFFYLASTKQSYSRVAALTYKLLLLVDGCGGFLSVDLVTELFYNLNIRPENLLKFKAERLNRKPSAAPEFSA